MLQGTFETLALPELLGLLASARKTGALRLEAGPVSGVIHLQDGHCLAVETAEHLGRADDGPALLSRLVDVCFAVTRQESGAFRFATDEPAPWRSDEPVELSDALVEVDRLLKQWREILQVIPSLDCRPRMLDQLGGDEVVIDRAHWALLVAIDGHRSVRDLVQHADRPVIDVCHSLLELVEGGAVGILDPAEPAPSAAAPSIAAPSTAAPIAPAPAPTPAPAPVAPVQIAAPQAVAAATAPTASAEAAPVTPKPVDTPVPVPFPVPAAASGNGNGNGAQAHAEVESARAQPEATGDEGGEAPDKGAFLRLFSGLRDG